MNPQFLDILPIPLQNPLNPGDTIKKKLWICAHPGLLNADTKNTNSYSLYFAYNIPLDQVKKPLMRMLRKDLTLKILPCLSISAAQVNPCKYDDKTSQGLLVKITNDSSQQAYISQVGLISSNRYLNKIVSSNQNTPVLAGESIVLGLNTCQADQSGGINLTHLKMQGSSPNLDTTPYVNFLKDGFNFDKEGAKIDGNHRVVVLWSTKDSHGLLHTKITDEQSISTDQVDHTDVFSSTESVESPLIPMLKKACKIQVVIDKNLQHDFQANPLCLVPFSISVENYLQSNSMFRYKTSARGDYFSAQDLGRYLGCTQACVPMPGQSRRQFQFHVTVSSPGLYSYQGLSFQMTNEGDECDTDEYIPLQVDFIVQ